MWWSTERTSESVGTARPPRVVRGRSRRGARLNIEAMEERKLLSTAYDVYLAAVTGADSADKSTVASDYSTYQPFGGCGLFSNHRIAITGR